MTIIVVVIINVLILRIVVVAFAHRCTGGLMRKVGKDPDGVRSLI